MLDAPLANPEWFRERALSESVVKLGARNAILQLTHELEVASNGRCQQRAQIAQTVDRSLQCGQLVADTHRRAEPPCGGVYRM